MYITKHVFEEWFYTKTAIETKLLIFALIFLACVGCKSGYTVQVLITFLILVSIFETISCKKHAELLQTTKLDAKDYENKIDSGDIILFRTYTSFDIFDFLFFIFFGDIVTENFWTHVGTTIKIDGKLYIFESAESYEPDNFTKRKVSGVKLSDFKEKTDRYNGTIVVLKTNLTEEQKQKLNTDIFKYKNIPFVKSLSSVVLPNRDIHKNGIGCVEVVIDLFKKCGLLKPEIKSLLFKTVTESKNYTFDFKIRDKYLIKYK